MKIKLILVSFFALVLSSLSALGEDCLTKALKQNNQELIDFYSYIAAVYDQENTSPEGDNPKDKFELLNTNPKDILDNPDVSMADKSKLKALSMLLFPSKFHNPVEWLSRAQEIQNQLKGVDLLNVAGIQRIHDAAIYGPNKDPFLCAGDELKSVNDVLVLIKDNYSDIENNLKEDERYLRVLGFRNDFPKEYENLKIGAEIELFSPNYFVLFKDLISEKNALLWLEKIYKDICTMGKDNLIGDINKKIFSLQEKGIDISVVNNLGDLKNTKDNLLEILPYEIMWVSLADYLFGSSGSKKKKSDKIFSYISMAANNFLIDPDESGYVKYYGIEAPKVELIHKRPYKNVAAYLESLLLISDNVPYLQENLLKPNQQLNDDSGYTHHVHISYAKTDLTEVGKFLQDTIALSILINGENAFTTDNLHIKYEKDIRPSIKHLIRIAPENQGDRLEFRRQFSGWSYEEFLTWLINDILTVDQDAAINNVKKLNNDLLNKININGYDNHTQNMLEHIAKQNII